MKEFDHVGLTTTVKQPNEMWVEATRVWVTNPGVEMIEYLRYEPDSPVDMLVRERPHLAFRTDLTDPKIVVERHRDAERHRHGVGQRLQTLAQLLMELPPPRFRVTLQPEVERGQRGFGE